jgi:hypothetical protein
MSKSVGRCLEVSKGDAGSTLIRGSGKILLISIESWRINLEAVAIISKRWTGPTFVILAYLAPHFLLLKPHHSGVVSSDDGDIN